MKRAPERGGADGLADAEAAKDCGAGEARAPLLVEGETCWRVVKADRLAIIVDAADYFAIAKRSLLEARRSVFLIGWDFDLRIALERIDPMEGVPDALGAFLRHLIRIRRGLRIHALRWDLSFFHFPFRATLPLKLLDWLSGDRLSLRADRVHPLNASHHQKIVVIDDCLAFCGGIDMTQNRWDTPAHRDDEPLRATPLGLPAPPWHDATACLDGEAARALGDLSRTRWRRATGQALVPTASENACWPDGLEPDFRNVTIGISRTQPAIKDAQAQIREIEALYLTAIQAARRNIYIETQYFASRRIAEAMMARLKEPDGPEIVVVNPRVADGWLEEKVMGAARATLLERVRRADRHDRFRIYAPVTEGGVDIYVHAKIMIVDDRFLKVGSSNLNNRSMGLDTECDLAIDAEAQGDGAEAARRAIARMRERLVREHLGATEAAFRSALEAAQGSLIAAIDSLAQAKGRSLAVLSVPPPSETEKALTDSEALDPQQPESISSAFRRSRALPWGRVGAGLGLGVAGAAAARFVLLRLRAQR
jgi:phospholipase D1/2